MLYLQGDDGVLKIIILESKNIEELLKGRPAMTVDKSVLIGWVPDMEWLVEKIKETGGDASQIGRLIDEASKRPRKEPRPYHEPVVHDFRHVSISEMLRRRKEDDDGL